jgi:hypothetical protein
LLARPVLFVPLRLTDSGTHLELVGVGRAEDHPPDKTHNVYTGGRLADTDKHPYSPSVVRRPRRLGTV